MSTLGSRIKESRVNKGLLQGDLARLIGVKSAGVISNWEKDLNKPDAEKLVSLCSVLDVSLNYLLNYEDHKKPDVLSPEERNLIRLFRAVSPGARQRVLNALEFELSQESAEAEKGSA